MFFWFAGGLLPPCGHPAALPLPARSAARLWRGGGAPAARVRSGFGQATRRVRCVGGERAERERRGNGGVRAEERARRGQREGTREMTRTRAGYGGKCRGPRPVTTPKTPKNPDGGSPCAPPYPSTERQSTRDRPREHHAKTRRPLPRSDRPRARSERGAHARTRRVAAPKPLRTRAEAAPPPRQRRAAERGGRGRAAGWPHGGSNPPANQKSSGKFRCCLVSYIFTLLTY